MDINTLKSEILSELLASNPKVQREFNNEVQRRLAAIQKDAKSISSLITNEAEKAAPAPKGKDEQKPEAKPDEKAQQPKNGNGDRATRGSKNHAQKVKEIIKAKGKASLREVQQELEKSGHEIGKAVLNTVLYNLKKAGEISTEGERGHTLYFL